MAHLYLIFPLEMVIFHCYVSSPQNTMGQAVENTSERNSPETIGINDKCRDESQGSSNVPIEHHPTIRYMVYNGYYKVMSNIPKMGHLPTPDEKEHYEENQPGDWSYTCSIVFHPIVDAWIKVLRAAK